MSIRFYCSCGKHLKARAEMAGRRSLCPACGSPVGVPSLQPTQRGTEAAPLSLDEKKVRELSTFRGVESTNSAAPPATRPSPLPSHHEEDLPARDKRWRWTQDPNLLGQVVPRKRRHKQVSRIWPLERRWHHCLTYPLRAWQLVLALAVTLAVFLGVAALALPDLGELQAQQRWLWLVCWLWPFLICGYGCAFFQCVLASGSAGEVSCIRWPGADVVLILRSFVIWAVCFLSGPVVFAVAGFLFWLHCGDPAWVDYVILANIGMAGGSYWLLTLIVVHQGDRLVDANPYRVADLIRRLGYSVVLTTCAAGLVALLHVHLVATALEQLHRSPFEGSFYLLAATCSFIYWGAFLFRLLGIWCHKSRVEMCA